MSSAGDWLTVFYQIQSQYSHLLGDFKALYPSMCWQTLWRCCFSFSADLSNCIHAKTFAEHIINGQQTLFCRGLWLASHVRWPEAHWKSIVKRKTRNNWSKNTDEMKATIKASIKVWQCHKLTTSTPSRINAIICSKGPPSTECISEIEHYSTGFLIFMSYKNIIIKTKTFKKKKIKVYLLEWKFLFSFFSHNCNWWWDICVCK